MEKLQDRITQTRSFYKGAKLENQIIQDFCLRYAYLLELFAKNVHDSFQSRLQNQPGELPGIPGTQEVGLSAVSAAFEEFSGTLSRAREQLKKLTIETFKESMEKDDQDFEQYVCDAAGPLEALKQTGPIIQSFSAGKIKQIQELESLVLKNLKKPKPKVIEQIKKLVDVLHEERRAKYDVVRRVVEQAKRGQESYKQGLTHAASVIEKRNKGIVEMFDTLVISYVQIAADLNLAVSTLNSASDSIDPATDLRGFSRVKGMCRFDIEPVPFVEIDVGDDVPIQRPIDYLEFPVALARVLQTHIAQADNELSIRADSYVLMMESNNFDWCYCMHPFTMETGFLPSMVLDPIGIMLGICREDIFTPIQINAGEFVAITAETPQSFTVLTTQGQTASVPRTPIGILFD